MWGCDIILREAQFAVANSGPVTGGRHLRLFTLGIGHGASTDLCEGLARVGNGDCYMMTQSEEVVQRCVNLLNAAKSPPIASLYSTFIDWGCTEVTGRSAIGDTFPKASPVQQAPLTTTQMFNSNRFVVSAILSNTTVVPRQVFIRGRVPGGNEFSLPIPVYVAQSTPMLHTLAARRIITELQDGETPLSGSSSGTYKEPSVIAKATIETYSICYQLVSKYTAFVVVEDEDEKIDEDGDYEFVSQCGDDSQLSLDEGGVKEQGRVVTAPVVFEQVVEDTMRLGEVQDNFPRGNETRATGQAPGRRPGQGNHGPTMVQSDSVSETQCIHSLFRGGTHISTVLRKGKYYTYCSKYDQGSWSIVPGFLARSIGELRKGHYTTGIAQVLAHTGLAIGMNLDKIVSFASDSAQFCLQHPEFDDDYFYVPPVPSVGIIQPKVVSPCVIMVCSGANVAPVARLQAFNGSFSLNDDLVRMLRDDLSSEITLSNLKGAIPDAIRSNPQAETIWATVLAVAHLKLRMPAEKEVWKGMWNKAMEYVLQTIGDADTTAFSDLLEDAMVQLRVLDRFPFIPR